MMLDVRCMVLEFRVCTRSQQIITEVCSSLEICHLISQFQLTDLHCRVFHTGQGGHWAQESQTPSWCWEHRSYAVSENFFGPSENYFAVGMA